MGAKNRRQDIEERVVQDGEVSFSALAEIFGVSEMTIRRDIEAIEANGMVRRVFGGAIALAGKSTEPPFSSRVSAGAEVKAHLASAVVDQIGMNETVILDSGSTVLAVARALRGSRKGLTVVTNSVLAALELVDESDISVLMAGGLLRPGELSIIGTEAQETFERYNCDCFVMGIAGIDAEHGLSEYHREEGNVKRAAMRAADRLIVVADSTKLGRVQLLSVATLAEIHTLVTDGDPEDPALVAASKAGVRVVCVPQPKIAGG